VGLAAERPDLVDRLVLISLADGSDFDRYPQLRALLDIAKVGFEHFAEGIDEPRHA
jgi:pimeloyl-ACP methyl ester carboxylesterase